MKVQEIREIIRLVDQTTISEFTYEDNGSTIKIKKQTVTKPTQQPKNINETVGSKQVDQDSVVEKQLVQKEVVKEESNEQDEAIVEGVTEIRSEERRVGKECR